MSPALHGRKQGAFLCTLWPFHKLANDFPAFLRVTAKPYGGSVGSSIVLLPRLFSHFQADKQAVVVVKQRT